MSFPTLNITVPQITREQKVDQFLARYHKALMTDSTIASLRQGAHALSIGPVRVCRKRRCVAIGQIGADQFHMLTGRLPIDDDLERINCTDYGAPGHMFCGWCDEHEMPRWKCGCSAHAPGTEAS